MKGLKIGRLYYLSGPNLMIRFLINERGRRSGRGRVMQCKKDSMCHCWL